MTDWTYTAAAPLVPLPADTHTLIVMLDDQAVFKQTGREQTTALDTAIAELFALRQQLTDLGDARGTTDPAGLVAASAAPASVGA